MVSCFRFYGGHKNVDPLEISFRPSVYGIILMGDNILVAKTKNTGKFALPGGGIDTEDDPEIALKREVKEETGVDISVEKFLHFNKNYFYYDPSSDAFDSYQYFYLCKPLKTHLASGAEVDDLEAEDPEWIHIKDLNEKNFQGIEMGILEVIKRLGNEKSGDHR